MGAVEATVERADRKDLYSRGYLIQRKRVDIQKEYLIEWRYDGERLLKLWGEGTA
jgi:hypothetical protein